MAAAGWGGGVGVGWVGGWAQFDFLFMVSGTFLSAPPPPDRTGKKHTVTHGHARVCTGCPLPMFATHFFFLFFFVEVITAETLQDS
jgi:hypothetical protein